MQCNAIYNKHNINESVFNFPLRKQIPVNKKSKTMKASALVFDINVANLRSIVVEALKDITESLNTLRITVKDLSGENASLKDKVNFLLIKISRIPM